MNAASEMAQLNIVLLCSINIVIEFDALTALCKDNLIAQAGHKNILCLNHCADLGQLVDSYNMVLNFDKPSG
jgi:hypothetical protein